MTMQDAVQQFTADPAAGRVAPNATATPAVGGA